MSECLSKIIFCDSKKVDRKSENQNALIIGYKGKQKMDSFIIPNLLQPHEETLFITDAKGYLMERCSHALESDGYTIRCLDIDNLEKGDSYNPFRYLVLKDINSGRLFTPAEGLEMKQEDFEVSQQQ